MPRRRLSPAGASPARRGTLAVRPKSGRAVAQRCPQRTGDPRGVLAARDAQNGAALAGRQLRRVDAEAAQRPVAADQRAGVAPVATGPEAVLAVQVVQRVGLLERAPQDGAPLLLGGVLDDRVGAAREREACRAGPQAEVDVLADVA